MCLDMHSEWFVFANKSTTLVDVFNRVALLSVTYRTLLHTQITS